MKNIKTKVILSTVVLLSVIGFTGIASAAGNSLYTYSATPTVTTGSNITTSVVAGTSGDKICAVQGKVVFNNLVCQSITLTGSLMAQTMPTCANPNFVIGIPNCTIANMALFTVVSKAGTPGTGTISFSDVNLIGEGVSVGNYTLAGHYNINALPVVVTPKVEEVKKPVAVVAPKETNETPEVVEKEIVEEVTPEEPVIAEKEDIDQTASIADLTSGEGFFGWIWSNIIWIILFIVILSVAYFVFRTKPKKAK
jgi:hypothetical protein